MNCFTTIFKLGIPIILVGMFCSCENSAKEIKKITFNGDLPDELSRDVSLIYSDSGKVRARMNAPLLERYTTKRQFVELREGIEVEFLKEDGSLETRLTADYARQYPNERRMEARDNVVVINENGDKLNTEQLVWDEKNRKIYSDAFVKITTETEILYGDGLEANESFTEFEIKYPKGILDVQDEDL